MLGTDAWRANANVFHAAVPTAPRTVEYNLTIGYFLADPDGVPVSVLGINSQLPSPTLSVTKGDTLIVNLRNEDPAHGHSLHWHGLAMKGANTQDGVVGVTQCSLQPFNEMQYSFVVEDDPGTYWYHGHSGLNKVGARGIAGMLIVHAREGEDPHSNLYQEEVPLFLQDWSHESPHDHYLKSRGGLHPPTAQSANAHNVALYPWTSGLINGIGDKENNRYSVLSLESTATRDDKTGVRMRICNGGENFALRVSIDCHRMLVISTDGTTTEPLLVDSVIVHLGERYDIIPIMRDDGSCKNADGNYWVRANTLENDKGAQVRMNHEVRAILRYAGSPAEFPTTDASLSFGVILNCFDVSAPSLRPGSTCLPITALMTHSILRNKYDSLILADPDETHEVSFEHSRGSKHYGHFTRIRPDVHDINRSVSHRSGNYTQFVLPGRPIYDNLAALEPMDHDHTLHLDLQYGNSVQIVWNHRSRTAHPIHIHGYKFIIAATHEAPALDRCSIVDCPDERDWFRWPLDKSVVDETLNSGNYIVKDTAVLPAGGYLVTRFKADNPGHWIAHCHTDFHLADGMGVILREGGGTPIGPIPPSFPSCSGAAFEAYDIGAMAAHQPACQCLDDPETILHAAPESTWKCSTDSLCRHAPVIGVGDTDHCLAADQEGGERVRGVSQERDWTKQVITIFLSILLVTAMILIIRYIKPSNPDTSNKPNDEPFTSYEQVRLLSALVMCYEWKKYMKYIMIVQVVGLATVGGLIYLDAGYDTSERAFREKIAFVFWQCAFWSVSTVYGSIVTYHFEDLKAMNGAMVWIEPISETNSGNRSAVAVSMGTYHLTRFAVSLLLASPWPFLFALVTESFSQMMPTVWATLGSGFILLLTQQAFDGMGCFLAEVAGPTNTPLAVCLGTIVSQLLVIAGGFYRTVPTFISAIGPIRYSFAAISKMTFSSTDSFWCTPDRAMAWRGYTFCSTELSGAIADLKIRGLNVIDSSEIPRIWPDTLALVVIIVCLRFACYTMARFNTRKGRRNSRRGQSQRNSGSIVVSSRRGYLLRSSQSRGRGTLGRTGA